MNRSSVSQSESGPEKSHASGEGIRINKLLASLGLCSRRQADEMIEAGRVRVNGEPLASPGARIVPGRDRVEVDGRELDLGPQAVPGSARAGRFTYILLHKPIEVVSTVRDPQGRKTVLDILPPEMREKRIYPVGRLDYFSEGLLLLTDDGELANRLTHPSWDHARVYLVRVRGHVSEKSLAAMANGMNLAEGEKLAPVEARILESDRRSTLLELTLHQGINRQIRRMCRDLGLTILMLRRIQHGPLFLGELSKGKARSLTPSEARALRASVGL